MMVTYGFDHMGHTMVPFIICFKLTCNKIARVASSTMVYYDSKVHTFHIRRVLLSQQLAQYYKLVQSSLYGSILRLYGHTQSHIWSHIDYQNQFLPVESQEYNIMRPRSYLSKGKAPFEKYFPKRFSHHDFLKEKTCLQTRTFLFLSSGKSVACLVICSKSHVGYE